MANVKISGIATEETDLANVEFIEGERFDETPVRIPVALLGGDLILLGERIAAASATLDFTSLISSTYDEYLIEFLNVIPATNTVDFYMRMSTNNGSSYDSAANYGYATFGANSSGSALGGAGSGLTQLKLNHSTIANTSTAGICGHLRLFSPSSTALHKRISGQFSNPVTLWENAFVSGAYMSTTAVDAFRFLFSSGNITSGKIRLYGIAKP